MGSLFNDIFFFNFFLGSSYGITDHTVFNYLISVSYTHLDVYKRQPL